MSSDEDYEANYSKNRHRRRGDDDLEIMDQNDKLMNLVSYQSGKLNLDMLDFNTELSHAAYKGIKEAEDMTTSSFIPRKDKKDRATVELVLDPRTRVILVKMLKRNFISEINGCISTGKEANVYHALTPTGQAYAIKIYKTSILIFKDRERYIEGEFRFRKGFNKSNPRKMVKLWAEKELRNLKRIYQSGIPCPEPLLVKSNVLVMEFLGDGMKAAPRLRNANLDTERLGYCYVELIQMMRTLYQECKLVHADLSEYNLLYWQDKIWMIDVSQSVEHDHPHALDFLRRDIACVNMYFRKCQVNTFSIKGIFDYITDCNINKAQAKERLEELIKNNQEWNAEESREDELFAQTHIPRTLQEISLKQMESDITKQKDKLLYAKLTGLDVDEKEEGGWVNEGEEEKEEENAKKVSFKEDGDDSDADDKDNKDDSEDESKSDSDDDDDDDDDDNDDSDDNDDDKDDDDSDEDGEEGEKKPHVPNVVLKDKEANKERKKQIKEEKKEKRKTKVSKYDKKKRNDKNHGKKANQKKTK